MQLGGFYALYSIDVRRTDNGPGSDRGKQRGLNSPHGRRGAICAHMGWTWHYPHEGIAWPIVQRLMIDAPSYDYDADDEDIVLTDDNVDQVLRMVNNMM